MSVALRVALRTWPRQSCLATSSRVDLTVLRSGIQVRHFSKKKALDIEKVLAGADNQEKSKTKDKHYPRNQEIKHRVVRLVNPETSSLDPPEELAAIFRRTDLHKFAVELVRESPEPIVKLIDLQQAFLQEKARQEKKREQPRPREEKEVQMTWGISPGDFAHKLNKARDELEAGNRVTIIFAKKKDQAALKPEEVEAKLQQTVESLADAGVEWKERRQDKLLTALYLQGHNLPPPLPPKSTEGKTAKSRYKERLQKRDSPS